MSGVEFFRFDLDINIFATRMRFRKSPPALIPTCHPALAGQPTTNGGSNGRYRVEFDRTIYATINGGGTEASFRSFNGKVLIRKK